MIVMWTFIYLWIGLVIWAFCDAAQRHFIKQDVNYYRTPSRMLFISAIWPLLLLYRPKNLTRED